MLPAPGWDANAPAAGNCRCVAPYIALESIRPALWVSIGVTLCALFIFGGIKGYFTGVNPWRGGLQTVLVGGLAAAAAFFIARLIS